MRLLDWLRGSGDPWMASHGHLLTVRRTPETAMALYDYQTVRRAQQAAGRRERAIRKIHARRAKPKVAKPVEVRTEGGMKVRQFERDPLHTRVMRQRRELRRLNKVIQRQNLALYKAFRELNDVREQRDRYFSALSRVPLSQVPMTISSPEPSHRFLRLLGWR